MRELTPRQAEFVRLYLTGQPATVAARQAGYATHYARRACTHLLDKPHIAAAVAEARQKLTAKTQYDLETAVAEIDANLRHAKELKQMSAVAKLQELKLKAHGLLIDKLHMQAEVVDITSALAEARARVALPYKPQAAIPVVAEPVPLPAPPAADTPPGSIFD